MDQLERKCSNGELVKHALNFALSKIWTLNKYIFYGFVCDLAILLLITANLIDELSGRSKWPSNQPRANSVHRRHYCETKSQYVIIDSHANCINLLHMIFCDIILV